MWKAEREWVNERRFKGGGILLKASATNETDWMQKCNEKFRQQRVETP